MLKGKDLPRNDSYAGKYKKAFKAVRERASNYVKFEGAAVAADARS